MTDEHVEDRYDVREGPPTPAELAGLRAAAEMTPRPREGLERGLPNSLFAVRAVDTTAAPDRYGRPPDERSATDGPVVGTARVVGDGGSVYHVCDTVVHPDHQRRGLGTRLMAAVEAYVEADAPDGAAVNPLADVEGFSERFGYTETRPVSTGMQRRVGADVE